MQIIAVDPFYLRMPKVTDAADGTQDTFLVRIRTNDELEGWGESDASPLVCMAVYCCPMSHGNIIAIRDSLLGERVESPEDVRRLHAKALRNGLDIQQIHHAYSAADIALWDIVGKRRRLPVYALLGEGAPQPKLSYASVLFGDTPEETRDVAVRLRERGFRAAKFGWGPMGHYGADYDVALVRAAREGMGDDAEVMVDAGVAWGEDAGTALARAQAFAPFRPTWLEEPLFPSAVRAYAELRRRGPPVAIAAGEGAGFFRQAEDLVENAGLDFVQIDVGRIGGITTALRVRELAERRGICYVNHTFKSHLSLAAALHVFATSAPCRYLEYPAAGSPLAQELADRLPVGRDGHVRAPERPGLGVRVHLDAVRRYRVPVTLEIGGARVDFPEP
jgi:L-alanine-DL-glutamate epimerase-like enolase superfamily enzyme